MTSTVLSQDQLKNADAQPSSNFFSQSAPVPLSTIKRALQEQIESIGQTDPERASQLSGQLLRYSWTVRDVEAIRSLGLCVDPNFAPYRLLGGGISDMVGVVVSKGIHILVKGNVEEVEKKKEDKVVSAFITLPDDSEVKGKHEGSREVTKVSSGCLCFCPNYELYANGSGTFTSERVSYKGGFLNNLFHDLTATAEYYVTSTIRYTGCFSHGKREGVGKLERYDEQNNRFYMAYEGIWRNDREWNGVQYTKDGVGITLKEGILMNLISPNLPFPENTPAPDTLAIGERICKRIDKALSDNDYQTVVTNLNSLQDSVAIDRIYFEKLLESKKMAIAKHFQAQNRQFNTHCLLGRFKEAEPLLKSLEQALQCLPVLLNEFSSVKELHDFYALAQEKQIVGEKLSDMQQKLKNQEDLLKGKSAEIEALQKAKTSDETSIRTLGLYKQTAEREDSARQQKLKAQEDLLKGKNAEIEELKKTLVGYEASIETLRQQEQTVKQRLSEVQQTLQAREDLLNQKIKEVDALEKRHANHQVQIQARVLEAQITEGSRREEIKTEEEREKSAAEQCFERELQQLQVVESRRPPVPAMAFGAADWKRYFGEVGFEPPLPLNIEEILNSPCPIWSGKKIRETHLLTLIPATVNKRPLTLGLLEQLIKRPKEGRNGTGYSFYSADVRITYADTPAATSHWVLTTCDPLSGTGGKNVAQQQTVLAQYNGYEVPRVLEISVVIAMEYAKTGTRLYREGMSHTVCQEEVEGRRVTVGGFAREGFVISILGPWVNDVEHYGLGAQKRLL